MSVDCVAVEPVRGAGFQTTLALTFERAGQEKPVCVAEILFRFYPGGTR
jgi:acyl dehydratase